MQPIKRAAGYCKAVRGAQGRGLGGEGRGCAESAAISKSRDLTIENS